MKRLLALASAVAFSLPLAAAGAQQKSTTDEVVRAADNFLGTLSAEQRQKVMYAFDDATQRARWSNFPTGFVPRGGISLKQMSAPQQEAAMKLLGTVLSPMGLEKVNEIRQADDDFKANGSKRGPGVASVHRGLLQARRAGLRHSLAAAVRVDRVAQAGVLPAVATCSEAISTSSHFLEHPPRSSRGCCSSAGTTWR